MQKNVMKNLCYAKLGALAFAANFNAKRLRQGVLPGRGTFFTKHVFNENKKPSYR
jgi:hypothetical protein